MPNKIEDTRVKKLLISNMLYKSSAVISQLFLNIFLFKTTNNVQIVALFNLAFLSAHLLSFTLFAKVVKFWNRNITHVLAICWLSLMYLSLILLWENVVDYYILLAIWMWFFSWIYWIWYNNNEFDLTSVANRWNFHGLKRALKIFTVITVPALIWIIIWTDFLWQWYVSAFW